MTSIWRITTNERVIFVAETAGERAIQRFVTFYAANKLAQGVKLRDIKCSYARLPLETLPRIPKEPTPTPALFPKPYDK